MYPDGDYRNVLTAKQLERDKWGLCVRCGTRRQKHLELMCDDCIETSRKEFAKIQTKKVAKR